MVENLNPLQEEKKARAEEILEEQKNQEEKPKPKRRRRKSKAKVEEPEQPQLSPEQEAGFMLDLFEQARFMVLKVPTPINPQHRTVFVESYKGMVAKYGDFLGKYMVETMFAYSIALIGIDTFVGYKMVKQLERKAEKEKDDSGYPGEKGERQVNPLEATR